jgi:hypothetical protein
MGLRSGLFAGDGRTLTFLSCHVRMSLQEGYHMREKDVFPVMHRVEIACNDNKPSPMML